MNIFWHYQGHRTLGLSQNRTENRVVEPGLYGVHPTSQSALHKINVYFVIFIWNSEWLVPCFPVCNDPGIDMRNLAMTLPTFRVELVLSFLRSTLRP